MIKVMHRVNNPIDLKKINSENGIEVDLHGFGKRIVVNHDPFVKSVDFFKWLNHYNHKILFVNIKEEGIESDVLKILNKKNISNFVLFDVSFPFIYKLLNKNQRKLALRISKFEAFDGFLKLKIKPKWVWIDLFEDTIPLSKKNYMHLRKNKIKIIIVSPELHGRNVDNIKKIKSQIKRKNFNIDAVCTKVPNLWN